MLNAKNFGLAGGVLWGVAMFIFTFITMYTGYGSMWAALMVDVYPGYDITIVGSIIGLIYGFIDGFIGLSRTGQRYDPLDRSRTRHATVDCLTPSLT